MSMEQMDAMAAANATTKKPKRSIEAQLAAAQERTAALRERGHFFAFGPALSRQVAEVHVGPVTSTHPKAGQRAAPPTPPREKVRGLLAQLADLPREAEEEARSLVEARRRIAELERQVAAKPKPPEPPAPKVERVEVPVVPEEALRAMRGLAEALGKAQIDHERRVGKIIDDVEAKVVGRLSTLERLARDHAAAEARPRPVLAASVPRPPSPPRPRAEAHGGEPGRNGAVAGKVSGSQQRILDALAYFESIDVAQPRRGQVALVARVSSSSSGFERNLSVLRTAGIIDYPGPNLLALTDAGRGAACAPDVPPTSAELHEAIYQRVSRSQADILRHVIGIYPEAAVRLDLAAAVQVSAESSGFERNLSVLRSLGLVDYPSPGEVVALPVLFLEGSRR